jgi:isopentenyl-diphosphate delta-isomerase
MEQVILVNENDQELGAMEKMEAHRLGVLHRAFSVFIFNERGQMLLQQRAMQKYHSAGLWTNACCSHPRPGEEVHDAANRRLNEELGFATALKPIFNFVYKANFENGLIEHEFDHVFFGIHNAEIYPNPNEVMNMRFENMDSIRIELKKDPSTFTAWFQLAFERVFDRWRLGYST